jgi:ABC-type bacteriocin/lantibiotic exporter with double-glycine peptidase domain
VHRRVRRVTTRLALLFLMFAAALHAEPGAAVWINVPFVHQPREGCGAASISMVMQYWASQPGGRAVSGADVDEIQHKLYSSKEHGIPASSMEQYLRQHGFVAIAFSGNWDDLDQQLRKGRPLIAAVKPQGQSQFHYVVIDGIDPAHALVMMNDPAERKLLTQERAGFEKEWSATRNWVLLAVPAEPLPHPQPQ